jgi:hypothetical protein
MRSTLRVIALVGLAAACGCTLSRFEVSVDGQRNAALGEVLDLHSAALEACYAKGLANDDNLSGRIVLRALVMQDGTPYVPAARVSDPQLVEVARCMLQQLSRWRFPASQDAEYVSIPLILKTVRVRRPSVRLLDPEQLLDATSVLAGPLESARSVPAGGA